MADQPAAAAAAAAVTTPELAAATEPPQDTNATVEPSTPTPIAEALTTPDSEDNDPLSQKVTLADLCAKGTALYAQKNYEEAAEQYGKAAELQAEQNGEMNPENADILFLYGRCVFRLGQERSDVLGGKAPEKKTQPQQKTPKANGAAGSSTLASAPPPEQPLGAMSKESQELLDSKKPLFQFTGDENFEDSDADEDDASGEDGEGDDSGEDDDLAVAFEVLDLARLLFDKKLKQVEEQEVTEDESKAVDTAARREDSAFVRHIKERLADVHDLLGEISLENERYTNAITDARESLRYKMQLYPEDSEIIAEAHFKLSLALEFASITTTAGEDDGKTEGTQQIDQVLRDEAVRELEAALKSTKLKLQAKEVDLATMASPEENEVTRAQIADVQDIIADMEQRLIDLRGPPVDLNTALASNPLGGVLGAAMGASAAETQARIEEAKKTARDVSGLVRKKGKPEVETTSAPAVSAPATEAPVVGSKRKAEEDLLAEPKEEKRARTEEPAEEDS
ncbi:NASP-related protein sim3 [Ceratocystis fimbriata CBS 114723]|uniref:NASP-related protein sim3 n=1 Tax=Ceratocystis fimbriata CBS 114723 TaxID=1035309 RepID=A0A2C5WWI3_9PEZI|nr:NASP-related protein sim3 [Ceratocystis fimbriata CBS 114723]